MTQSVDEAVLDRPLTRLEDDRLGYAPFAKHLATSVLYAANAATLTLAVYAPQGCGRTTLLNYVEEYLRRTPVEHRPYVLNFDPLCAAGPVDLVARLLEQALAVVTPLRDASYDESARTRSPAAHETSVGRFGSGADGADEAPRRYPIPRDIDELKQNFASVLCRQNQRLVVIIDDVDRLSAAEIEQLFRLLKSSASLPGLLFLLALDPNEIERILAGANAPGLILDDLIQAPFILPSPDRTSLRQILSERLEEILDETPDELFNAEYWRSVYLEGLDHFITRPSDLLRLSNTLALTYPPVRGSVNFVDFVAVEILRLQLPSIYDIIRKNLAEFCGKPGESQWIGLKGSNRRAFHESWLRQVPEESKEPLQRLLMSVFPRMRLVWRGAYFANPWEARLGRRLSDCDPESIPNYFRSAVPEGGISNLEMRSLVFLARDPAAFSAKLVELARQPRPDGATRLRAFLENFLEFARVEEVPPDGIPSIIHSFLDVGDELTGPVTRPGRLYTADALIIRRIILLLLRELPETDSFNLLKRAIAGGRAVGAIVDIVANVDWQHGRYNMGPARVWKRGESSDARSAQLLNARHVEELEGLALEKIRAAAKDGSLADSPVRNDILAHWRKWASDEEVTDWLRAHP
ncbi:MAG TPA: P-loop NTPase fold protein [Armatimonadota bacterium]|nr:P-loop NTPase fold protein [Armatimonadota bacterium]